MKPARGPLFLERQSYRRRRLIDAARVIPVFGTVLFLLPLLWEPVPAEGVPLSVRGIYLFAVWGVLMLGTFIVSRRLQSRLRPPPEAKQDGAGDGDVL